MIELRNISKTFEASSGKVDAVKDVNLTIEDGTIFGIIGFSGAGKSTLVRCINLLERPTKGNVIVDDKDLMTLSASSLREVRKKIGMIFQHFNLMKSRTVAGNIAYPLKNSGLSKGEIQTKVKQLLELVDLKDKEHAYPSQLSGGQKQRVAIARALANDPKVLLCDEATSALDPQTTQSILKLLKEVNQRLGITIILITHEMAVVKEICQKVAVMENGYVVEEGDILDIFSQPKEQITKNFINSTSSINKIYELIDENHKIVDMDAGDTMVKLTYSPNNTGEALISKISRDFEVDTSIIFGNIEVIQGAPLGALIVVLSGSKINIDKALKCLEDNKVKVEVMKEC